MITKITKSDRPKFYGSLHKLYNGINGRGLINWNDYSFSDIVATLEYLDGLYGIRNSDRQIYSLEFGFNIEFSEIDKLLNFQLLSHIGKGICAAQTTDRGNKITSLRINKEQWSLKAYNKYFDAMKIDKNNAGPRDNLRIEIVLTKSPLRALGIYTIEDLKNQEVYYKLLEHMLSIYDGLVLIDSLEPPIGISPSKKRSFEIISNVPRCKEYMDKVTSQAVRKRKRDFKKTVRENGLDSTAKVIRVLIKNKFDELIQGLPFSAFLNKDRGLPFSALCNVGLSTPTSSSSHAPNDVKNTPGITTSYLPLETISEARCITCT